MSAEALEAGLRASIAAKERLLASGLGPIRELARLAAACLDAGGKILCCGNGGSACDAAHLACELCGWFLDKARAPIPALALGQSVASLTAVANDAGYAEVFCRELDALGRAGDLLVGISTSGRSQNVLRALERGGELGLVTVALTGARENDCARAAELWVPVPTDETPRVQECHLLVVHLLCAFLEERTAR